ncbi:MAG: hypothetical protein LC637_03575 [Xanthomonadaceae bacterium]|nr:hypothetical protein [Xanthomonadaceae bacterium]
MRVELPGRSLHLEAESHGNPSDPAVIMIMGLGLQLIFWPDELIGYLQKLISHAGLEIIDGMAHFLPQACLARISDALVRHLDISPDRSLRPNSG